MSLSYDVNEDGLLKLQQAYNNCVLNAIKGKIGIYRPVYKKATRNVQDFYCICKELTSIDFCRRWQL
jgi:hypothetical protein